MRKEFETCKAIIRAQLEETHGMCEYANYGETRETAKSEKNKLNMQFRKFGFFSCSKIRKYWVGIPAGGAAESTAPGAMFIWIRIGWFNLIYFFHY